MCPLSAAPAGAKEKADAVSLLAIDASGARYITTRNQQSRWLSSVKRFVKPDYPFESRRLRREGAGTFRLGIDLKTRAVNNAAVLRSTGVAELDAAAIAALKQWQWNPHENTFMKNISVLPVFVFATDAAFVSRLTE